MGRAAAGGRGKGGGMGKGRDKRKKKKTAGGKAHDQARKEEKAEGKRARREERRAEGGEDDIDALLARIELEEKQARGKKGKSGEAVEWGEVTCERPSPRGSCSVVSVPGAGKGGKGSSLYVFGGEHYDGKKTRVFGDLYRFDVDRSLWSIIRCPRAPKPRSGHQCVLSGPYLWLFGGEYTSPNQEKFRHFRDLWRFCLETQEWEQLELKKGPTARSGHRMVAWKGTLVMFGGYYDTGDVVKYHGDLWLFDTSEMRWESHGAPGQLGPSPRSACQILAHAGAVWLYGGYAKIRGDEEMEHGKTFEDMWRLDLESLSWEKVKKAGIAPGPRAGCTMVVQPAKDRAFFFGGVRDHETQGGELMVSEFFNEAFFFNFGRRRWFPVTLRGPGVAGAGDQGGGGGGSVMVVRASAQTPETQAAVRIQAHYRGFSVRKAYKTFRLGGKVTELLYSPAVCRYQGLKNVQLPHPRINAGLALTGSSTLWLLGGMFENRDAEITLDDIWTLDITKLNGWKCLLQSTQDLSAWEGSDDEWEEVGPEDDA